VRALPYQFRIYSFIQKEKMGGEGACTWRVYTQTHTQLHLFIKEYCTVLYGYCNSRLKIEICRCTILYATERDCLAMTNAKESREFLVQTEGGMRTLRFFSSLPSSSPFFRFLAPPHRAGGACQVRPEATPPPGFGP
jgi:hypothetical protein